MKSVGMRFTVTALLVHAVFGAAVLGATYRLLDHALQQQLQQAAVRSHEQLAAALQPLLIARDFAGAGELLQSLVDQGGFQAVEVFDRAGRPFAQAARAPAPGATPAFDPWFRVGREHHHRGALSLAGQPLGAVHLVLDARDVVRAKEELLLWMVLLGGAGLAANAALLLALTRRLSGRLRALADAAGQVAEGAHGVALPQEGGDDLARLTQSFNRMARTLEQRFAELQASEQRQRELTEALTEGIVFQDRDERVLNCNDAATRILGLSREQLLGLDAMDPRWQAITPDGQPFDRAQHPSRLALRTGRPVRDVLIGVQAPGRGQAWISVNSQPLLAPGEATPHATVTSFSDITARIQAEQALARANEDLEQRVQQRTAELAAARDVAEDASRAKSEFLSRMSHELRTPLNAILGFAQLLRLQPQGRDAAGFDEQMGHIESAGWHLVRLIDEVLDLSRIEAGALLVSSEPVAVAPVVAECLRLVAGQAAGQGLALLDTCEGLQAHVRADATRLRQVLVNLLSNACKYNRPGGMVRVSCRAEGSRWVLAVEDSGRGMDARQQSGLFQPFNRLGAERSGVPGTGIGLVITRRLVELMGGTITVRSAPGQGSRFEVALESADAVPLAAPPGGADGVPGVPAPQALLRLLLVEDNASNVRLLRDVLRLRPGVELLVAGDGPAGLRAASTQAPHAIVLDIALPGMDGLELCRALRQLPQMAGVPLVALSANALPADVARGLAAGFDDYFTKPLEIERFLAWIDAMLRSRSP